jgi:hypothetical protein
MSEAPSTFTRPVDPTPDGTTDALPQIAKVFNQEGFFGVSMTFDGPTGTAVAGSHIGRADAPRAPHALLSDQTPTQMVQAATVVAGRPGTALSINPTRLAPLPAASNPIATPSATATGTGEATLPPELELQSEGPVHGAAPKLPARAQAQSALRIAIRDLERGLQIIVAANALGTQERERLASEIAGLLSRYGFVPGEVRVTGVAQGQIRKNR